VARTVSVGVDIDALVHYHRIHGLPEGRATNAAWRDALPRFSMMFEALGVRATFYAVAADLAIPGNADRLRALVAQGHEIGNHTLNHRYDLTRMGADDRVVEVGQGRYRLEHAAEAEVVGFRAPGYNVSADLLRDVVATGHTYDSSVFPCAPYYGVKAGVIGLLGALGRPSQSIVGTPRVLFAPRSPYRMDPEEPHGRGDGLPEFPITVAAGVPMLGHAFTALGRRGAVAAAQLAARLHDHVTVEFHAADLLSLDEDRLEPALAAQRDLRVPLAHKRETFEAALRALLDGATCVRLCDLRLSPPNVSPQR